MGRSRGGKATMDVLLMSFGVRTEIERNIDI